MGPLSLNSFRFEIEPNKSLELSGKAASEEKAAVQSCG